MSLQIILFVWVMCFCWKTGVCKKGIFLVRQLQLPAIWEWKATAFSQRALPKELPIRAEPCSLGDLCCFMAGQEGTEPFHLNSFGEKRLLDVDFQQPLPSKRNTPSISLWMLTGSVWTTLHFASRCTLMAIYIILLKNACVSEEADPTNCYWDCYYGEWKGGKQTAVLEWNAWERRSALSCRQRHNFGQDTQHSEPGGCS